METLAGRKVGNSGIRPDVSQDTSAEVLASWTRGARWESMRNIVSRTRRLWRVDFEDLVQEKKLSPWISTVLPPQRQRSGEEWDT
jgi:hypothetical protein